MKVIDLLVKIANGEEVPNKITIDKSSYEFEWNGNMYLHRFCNKDGDYDFVEPDYIHNLDKEIHIIEDTPIEDKKIEKLDYLNSDYYYKNNTYGAISSEEIVLDIKAIENYINKLVDMLNGDK